ncbi:hypothetical protein KY317_04100 [Candidatus Woesearchaeota archaeon]|nr:hypothetical protein [Candidatus Woesearchaeota archaeon]
MVIDYISHKNLQWLIPNSILPYRLFGIVTIEILFWAVSLAYFIIMFYEYFLDKHITKKLWAPKLKYLIIIGLILLSAFILIYFINPSVFNIPYFYVIFGTGLFLIPVILELSTHTRLAAKFFRTAAYFSYLTFLYEVTALKLGWWSFPGTEFIGWINIFGVSFPIEELFFWIMLTALACLSWYEFFDDDQK